MLMEYSLGESVHRMIFNHVVKEGEGLWWLGDAGLQTPVSQPIETEGFHIDMIGITFCQLMCESFLGETQDDGSAR